MNKKLHQLILSAALALLTFHASAGALQNVPEGRASSLSKLWDKYEKAAAADLPARQIGILGQISREASEKRYSWDFWEAEYKLSQLRGSMNWKEAENAGRLLASAVEEYDEPIVSLSLALRNGTAVDFVSEHARVLRTTKHTVFYAMDPAVSWQAGFFRDDYDYALWALRLRGQGDYDHLIAYTEEYPLGQYAAWLRASGLPGKEASAEMERLLSAFEGGAVAFWCRQSLILEEYAALLSGSSSEEDYLALARKCRVFEKERSALRGDDALIAEGCRAVRDVLDNLGSKTVYVEKVPSGLMFCSRNVPEAEIRLKPQGSRKVLLKKKLRHANPRFHVTDTLLLELPAMEDGDYVAEIAADGCRSSQNLAFYSLGLALRPSDGGVVAFAVQAAGGEPLDHARLVLEQDGLEADVSEPLSFRSGYVPVPVNWFSTADGRYSIRVRLRDADSLLRMSRPVPVSRDMLRGAPLSSIVRDHAAILLGSPAYHPGETVDFKAILYRGDMLKEVAAFSAGIPLEAVLRDAQGREVKRIWLKTNDFGSAASSFELPGETRGGYFSIEVCLASEVLASEYFRVDDFVEGTMALHLDKDDRIYFKGDSILVSGRVASLSGHSLSAAELKCSVSHAGRSALVASGRPDDSGRFSFAYRIPSEDEYGAGYHEFAVSALDHSGETVSAKTRVLVADRVTAELRARNADEGLRLELSGDRYPGPVFSSDKAVFYTVFLAYGSGKLPGARISYELKDVSGKTRMQGCSLADEDIALDLASLEDGVYTLVPKLELPEGHPAGVELHATEMAFSKLCSEELLFSGAEYAFRRLAAECPEDGKAEVGYACSKGPVWMLAEVFGPERELLSSSSLVVGGDSRFRKFSFAYDDSWPDAVCLHLSYFKDGEMISFSSSFRRPPPSLALPFSLERMEDEARPGTEYVLTFRTEPGVEAAATAYDSALEAFGTLSWPVISMQAARAWRPVCSYSCQFHSGVRLMVKSAGVRENALMDEAAMYKAETGDFDDDGLREDFAPALDFLPFLYSGSDGLLECRFKTAHRLSTFRVKVFAHDRSMRNASAQGTFIVSLPVKLTMEPPRFLRKGDALRLPVSISAREGGSVPVGKVLVELLDADSEGGEPLKTLSAEVPGTAGGQAGGQMKAMEFTLDTDSLPRMSRLVLRARYISGEFSDGVSVTLPVLDNAQSLTEAHSAIWRPGSAPKSELVDSLKASFVNGGGEDARLREVSIQDLLKDFLNEESVPGREDVVSVSGAIYARQLRALLRFPSDSGGTATSLATDDGAESGLIQKLLACRCSDGGFAWFPGMKSSPILTALVLDRFARLAAAGAAPQEGIDMPALTAGAVSYLDSTFFGAQAPSGLWRLGTETYMHVRSQYPEVPWAISGKPAKAFKKELKELLLPRKDRGYRGNILAKVRRIKTLQNLSAGERTLAKSWGLGSRRKAMSSSIAADLSSLSEYVVTHPSGACYFPNAVLPGRGLLESEAYAHALLAEVLGGEIADGIRLWLMVQKETQHWESGPGFTDALATMLEASTEILATQVLVLEKTSLGPYSELSAAGNGFSLSRKFYRREAPGSEAVEIQPGDSLGLGETIEARYFIYSDENRSFVSFSAPREASLLPVNQLSGMIYSGFFPSAVSAYRDVRADRTDYYFDTFPEEDSMVSEEFRVVRAGRFSAPVLEILSEYAPHYRANGAWGGYMQVK